MRAAAAGPARLQCKIAPSPLGLLVCFGFSLATAMLTSGWHLAAAFAVTMGWAVIGTRGGLEALGSKRLWLLLAVLLVWSWLVLPTEEGLALGLQMLLRAVTIVVAVGALAAAVSIGELANLLEHAGLKGVGFALGVAVNMLPTVQETARNAYHALRLRGGFRRRRLAVLRLLLITVVVNTLRHADDIVSAAEARAFSPETSRPQPLVWRRADAGLLVALTAVTLGLVLL